MPILAGQLVQGQKLICIAPDETINQALSLMIEHDFSQLPVIDQSSKLLGIVTGSSIAKAVLHFGAKTQDLIVRHATVKIPSYQADEDVLYLLDTILRTAAVFVVSETNELLGLITEYDTTQYFRQRTEDIMRLNDVEDALKEHLRYAYNAHQKGNTELQDAIDGLNNSLDTVRKKGVAALKNLCKSKNIEVDTKELEAIAGKVFSTREESRSFSDLSLSDYIQLAQKAWPKLEPIFGIPMSAWSTMMDDFRNTRNKLFHFKGDTTAVERHQIQFCADWYKSHPPIVADAPVPDSIEPTPANATDGASDTGQTVATTEPTSITSSDEPLQSIKYSKLIAYLEARPENTIAFTMELKAIERMIGNELPKAAYARTSWWSVYSAHTNEWLSAGWFVSKVNSGRGYVTFKRASSQTINLQEPWEMSQWAAALDCSQEQLTEAIAKVGNRASDVIAHIKSQRRNGKIHFFFQTVASAAG